MPSTTSSRKPEHSFVFEAIGTQWSIETPTLLLDHQKRLIAEHIESFDHAYSRFRDDSLVAAMAKAAGSYTLPADAAKLGDCYRRLYDITEGALSPLVGMSLNAAGYDSHYSFRGGGPAVAPEWDEVMAWQGANIRTTQPLWLDVGAMGKGLLVDEVAELLEQTGVKKYVIDASGDMRNRGHKQVIGLENPQDPTRIIGVMELNDASLCASATNRRRWGNDWHHVLDARTGLPVREVLATWVIHESTMVTDALATALFFVPVAKLTDFAPFQYVRLLVDGTVEYSEHFVGELYI